MNIFPLNLIRAALICKVRDMALGHKGPLMCVRFSVKYGTPVLAFCSEPTC